MKTLRVVVLGALWCAAFGCTEVEQPLGDVEAGAGQAGDEAGSSGSGTTGGAGSGGGSTGGNPNGGASTGGSGVGGVLTGGAVNGGASTGGGSTGGAANGGSGANGLCFSPDNPDLAVPPIPGCACNEDEDVDQCVVTGGNQLHMLGMVCANGTWTLVEDGPCAPGPGPWCMIEKRVLQPGSPVPIEILCEACWYCEGLAIPACTVIDCAPRECPAGTEHQSRCRQCGEPGGCLIAEHGCFSPCTGNSCEFGICDEGTCVIGPCI